MTGFRTYPEHTPIGRPNRVGLIKEDLPPRIEAGGG